MKYRSSNYGSGDAAKTKSDQYIRKLVQDGMLKIGVPGIKHSLYTGEIKTIVYVVHVQDAAIIVTYRLSGSSTFEEDTGEFILRDQRFLFAIQIKRSGY